MPAIMIPSKPKDYDPRSKEGVIFDALKKLPEDYYVFHSFHVTNVTPNNMLYDREMDFVIANRKKGILALEAKAGKYIDFDYHDRTWYYSSGAEMEHGGPYNQVATAKRTLMDEVKYHPDPAVKQLYKKCKFVHGVVFPDLTRKRFNSFQGLPEEADGRLTLCTEDLINPTEIIDKMFSLVLAFDDFNVSQTDLDEEEFKLLLESVLCPHFHIVASPEARNILLGERLNQLLYEQCRILDFLDEQPNAVINGAAGTGKTMLALEKAKRHSLNEESVLFLCYNKLLRKKLIEDYKESENKSIRKSYKNVDFMTISQLAKAKTGDFRDFDGLDNWLKNCIRKREKFEYKHVIVDEGQDFGLVDKEVDETESISNISILNSLQQASLESGGTFYLFYDRHQMIEGADNEEYFIPDCIEDADCRLTLHTNCRNTAEIAQTSVTPLRDKHNKAIKPAKTCAWNEPIKPTLHLISKKANLLSSISGILDKLMAESISDVVILTTKTITTSCLSEQLVYKENDSSYGYYPYKGKEYPVTTCKKYKGLEADAIVLIDLDKESFLGKNGQKFYVGSSRAKLHLDCVCKLAEQDYYEVAHGLDSGAPNRPNADRMRVVLGNIFSAQVTLE